MVIRKRCIPSGAAYLSETVSTCSCLCRRRPNLEFRPTFERRCPEEWCNLAKLCWSLKPEERPDFDRVVKMMTMIVASIREKVNERGYIPPEALDLI
jgi:hypothetical protein